MTGQGRRNKGSNAEREVAAILQQYGWNNAHRGMVFYHESDIEDAIPGLHLEVKRQEQTRLRDWIKQSEEQKKAGEIATVIHRRNREPWYITMQFTDFLTFIKKGDTKHDDCI